MAWVHNDEEVLKYINILKTLKYMDKSAVKTGVDNYKKILTYTKTLIVKRKREKQLLLNTVNTQLSKYIYYTTKLEEDMDKTNLYDNIIIFQQNMQTIGDISPDMKTVNGNIMSTITIDTSRLKQYKRTKKELIAKSIYLRGLLSFYEDSTAILSEIEGKLT